jgi:photosystem II stability/assembly factor-like uncharacterized protein
VLLAETGTALLSTNAGNNWTSLTALGSRTWRGAVVSHDGVHLALIADAHDSVYVSHDTGATWSTYTTLGSANWRMLAGSYDNSFLYAVASNSTILRKSTDGGATWSNVGNWGGSAGGYQVHCTSNGEKLIVSTSGTNQPLLVSTDYGVTFTTRSSSVGAPTACSSCGMSRDGRVVMASDYNYTRIGVSMDGGGRFLYVYPTVRPDMLRPIRLSLDGKLALFHGPGHYLFISSPIQY